MTSRSETDFEGRLNSLVILSVAGVIWLASCQADSSILSVTAVLVVIVFFLWLAIGHWSFVAQRSAQSSFISAHAPSTVSLAISPPTASLDTDVDPMTGVEFERRLRQLLFEQGYEVTTTKTSGDIGVDLTAVRADKRIEIQFK